MATIDMKATPQKSGGPDTRSIGAVVKLWRVQSGRTQAKFATDCELRQGDISLIENGRSDDFAKFVAVAKGFGILVSELMLAAEHYEGLRLKAPESARVLDNAAAMVELFEDEG